MSKWVAVAVLLLVATGCGFGNDARSCTGNEQCNSVEHPGGVCEPSTHLCSFPDTACPDGFRYGGLAGDHSNQCVPGEGSGSNVDAAVDSKPPSDTPPLVDAAPPDAQVCFGTGIVQVCLAAAPTGTVTALGATIDTTSSTQCAQLTSGGDFCVIAATAITLQTPLRAIGSRPLVLLASETITTNATIDVASRRVNGVDDIGAGADPVALCGAGAAPGSLSGTSGGGAGGSFTGIGGNGGAGAAINVNAPGGAGGLPGLANSIVSELRGGCPGQNGAGASADAGAGGHGGGAIFLLAGVSITVQQTINASGEGGGGGSANASGGGGGGTGGLIGFDAPTIAVNGLIIANGGGGGEGAGNTAGSPGNEATTPSAASGGTGAFNGGDGGNGSSGAAAGPGVAGVPGNFGFHAGGGGGGGGAGYVVAPQAASFTKEGSPTRTIQTP